MYEYKIIRESDPDEMEQKINDLAKEEWELVAATFEGTRHVVYMKRALSGMAR